MLDSSADDDIVPQKQEENQKKKTIALKRSPALWVSFVRV